MKKRKLKSLKLNKKSVSNFENISIQGGNDDNTTLCTVGCFTEGDECNTKDVFRCLTGDACPTVFGCPSFIKC